MEATRDIPLRRVRVDDAFWSRFQRLVKDVVIPYQGDILEDKAPGVEKSHAVENFRIAAGESEGEYYGMVFQDSDVAKWLEAVAYSLALGPDPALEGRADEVIRLIGKAQREDGYLNTYFTVKEPKRRWTNLQECHELYCAGHLIEAAVAYRECTGKEELLRIARRFADHIEARFGAGKARGVPGHEEIELALLRLWRATGEERYRDLALYFLNERGTEPDYFTGEAASRGWTHWNMDASNRKYAQNHAPVREQTDAEGHSVRAMYLYTAMADAAAETGDEALASACFRLWESVTQKRMYVTGGIGSTAAGEAFTIDYDLPNDSAYAETCASVGLVFFARKMLELSPEGRFADVMERALYNGVLSGMQLDGKRFFYVNPLEVVPGLSGELSGYRHVLPQRPEWYACACCPPNVARLLASLGKYAWGEREGTVYSHLYLGGEYRFSAAGGGTIRVESGYPWQGRVVYTVHPAREGAEFTLALRIPGWCKAAALSGGDCPPERRNGYSYLRRAWKDGDRVQLTLELPVRRIYANPAVRADAGCVALARGPVVYCFEQEDNGACLAALRLPRDEEISVVPCGDPRLGEAPLLKLRGERASGTDALYSEVPPVTRREELTAVPYFAWGNRGVGEMRVWMRES